jgi:long-chain acyl-CoA synthetase
MTIPHTLPEDYKTPLEMFYHWEASSPGRTWLRQPTADGWRDYSWQEAGAQCRRVAAELRRMGLSDGDKVGIYAANSAYWIMADLAIMMAGMTSVPIYPTMPADKMRYVAEHSDMTAVFADSSVLPVEQLRNILPEGMPILALDDACAADADAGWSSIVQTAEPLAGNPLRDRDDLWTIAYTSGTTGMPKGVMHSFATLPHSASEIHQISGADENARFFSYLPLAHIAERTLIDLHSLYTGASIGFNLSRESFADDLREIRPTFFFAVPRIWTNLKAGIVQQMGKQAWEQLIANPEGAHEVGRPILSSMGLDAVTFAFSGAAPIATDDIEAWHALGMPLYEGFGQSEFMSGTVNLPGHCRIGTVGRVLSDLTEMKLSEHGEILFRAPGNMLGYYKEPEKTAETIVDGWVHTGDKGAIDDEGYLRITGRVKEIFKTAKGKYVAPAPIENRFSANPHIDQLCLVGRGLPQTLLLVVLSPSAATVDRAELTATLEAQLDQANAALEAHERISQVIVCSEPWTIENGLLTHTLKILRDDVEAHLSPLTRQCVEGSLEGPVVWQ